MSETAKCEVCSKPAGNKCGKCHSVFYCSKSHQELGWKTHQKVCRPFKICRNEQLGRHLVATKAIKEGDVILQEFPLVKGPGEAYVPVCLGCLNVLGIKNIYSCKKCGLPLCDETCQNNPNHIPECYYISKRGEKASKFLFTYSFKFHNPILVLRCLYQKKFFPEVWRKLNSLESHYEKSRKSDVYETVYQQTVKYINDVFGLKNEFSDDELRKVCGIINANVHRIPGTTRPLRGIYENGSLLEHSCRANCDTAFSSDGLLRFIAGAPIDKGDHLSNGYINPSWTTIERQRQLQKTKLFTCHCNRCTDVTEFGTNLSAFKCQIKNCEGLLLPESFLNKDSQWTCNKCKYEMKAHSAISILNSLEKTFETATRILDFKTFLKDNKRLLPHNHSYVMRAKIELLFRIGNIILEGDLATVSDDDLKLKIDLCREMANFVKVIAPAERGMRGDILYNLDISLAELCIRKKSGGSFSSADFLLCLKERRTILNEVVLLLKYKCNKNKQCQTAKENLKMVENLLKPFQSITGLA